MKGSVGFRPSAGCQPRMRPKPGDTSRQNRSNRPGSRMPTRQWSCMGRSIAVALLGIGFLSLSCSRNFISAQAGAANGAAIAAAAGEPADPADYQQLGGLESRFETLATHLAPSVV